MSIPHPTPALEATSYEAEPAPQPLGIEHADPGSEAAILGAALMAPPSPQGVDPIATVQQILSDDDFAVPTNLTVWRAILDLYGHGKPTSPPAVASHLSINGDLARIGGQSTLLTLARQACPAVNVGHFAQLVRGQATLRHYRQALMRGMTATAVADPEHPADAMQAHLADVEALLDGGEDDGDFGLVSDDIDPHLDELAVPSVPPAALTGFTDLDSLMRLEQAELIIVAARPAMGKSAFALGVAIENARAGNPTLIASMEMGRKEVTNRILASRARVPFHRLREGVDGLTSDDWDRLDRYTPELKDLPLWRDYSARTSPNRLRARIKTITRATGRTPLVVIDYLQLMQTDHRDSRQSLYERTTEISRELKVLAQDTDAVVMALAQLNRGPEQRNDKKPMASDLRDSGALEQDANAIILLHREDYYEPESPKAGETDLIVAKHRNGPTSTVTVAHQFHYSRLKNMADT